MDDWEIEENVRCVVAPCCAFTFDAEHRDSAGGGYSCPLCGERQALIKVDELSATIVQLTDQIARQMPAVEFREAMERAMGDSETGTLRIEFERTAKPTCTCPRPGFRYHAAGCEAGKAGTLL